MARITKRQLKEDKLVSTTAKLSTFLNEHWQEIAVVIVGVVVLVGALLLYYNYKTGKNEEAAEGLREARSLFAEAEAALESDGKAESTIEKYGKAQVKFQEVLRESGHDYTISEALFYSARCFYQLGEYDEAISSFQSVIDEYPKSIFALYARKGIGQCYEQLGGDDNLRKAIQQYDELSRYPETYITLRAFVDKGRCHEELKEWEKATAAYSSIVDKFRRNVESAIQAESKALVQKATDVISKYELALGKGQSDSDFAELVDRAKAYESQEQWFEALKMRDRAVFSRKKDWGEEKASGEHGQVLQDASDTLKEYEDLSADAIRNISSGRKYEKQGDWDNALRYYRGAVQFDFLPGMDLLEEAQFRIDWIESIEQRAKGVAEEALSSKTYAPSSQRPS